MPQSNYRFEEQPCEPKPPFEGGLPPVRWSSRNSFNARPDSLEPNSAWRLPSGSRMLAEESLSPPQLPLPSYGRILVPAYAMAVEAALSGEVVEIHESTVPRRWLARSRSCGQREINAMHLPVGRPIQLVMTSEDVIHDFSVPAFRIKHDVLPGRYETLWFQVNKPGTYHLFCTQLCGTGHSNMVGDVVAMSDPEYQEWLDQNGVGESMAAAGSVEPCSCAMAVAAATAETAPAEVNRRARYALLRSQGFMAVRCRWLMAE